VALDDEEEGGGAGAGNVISAPRRSSESMPRKVSVGQGSGSGHRSSSVGGSGGVKVKRAMSTRA